MLEIGGLSISYGENKVLENASLSAKTGVTCIIGKSGSGKSSILNSLVFRIPFECEKYLIGKDNLCSFSDEDKKAFVRNNVSYLMQENNFISDITCFENMALFAKMAGRECSREQIDDYLKMVGLNLSEDTYPDNLSGGERQRLALAQALAKDTPIIICDEITASLDSSLKNDIFHLIKEIARKYSKIVLMTSHDEDIFKQCDKLYEIKDHRLELIKDETNKDEELQIRENKHHELGWGIFRKYHLSKIERQFSMNIIYMVISALVVAISSFLIYFRSEYISFQNLVLNNLSDRELYVINQSTPIGHDIFTYQYFEDNQPFENDIFEKLNSIENVENVYPYYWGSFDDEKAVFLEREVPIFVTSPTDEKKVMINPDASDLTVMPYYPQQQFESKQIIVNEEYKEFGTYLTRTFLYNLGYSIEDLEVLKDCQLKATIYLPVASEIVHGTWASEKDTEALAVDYYIPQYKGAEIEIPIIGVIDPFYNEEAGASSIYIPFSYMEELRQKVSENVELKEGQLLWSPNAYLTFVDSPESLENVNLEIKKMDPMIATGSKYANNKSNYQEKNYIKTISLVALFVVLGAGAVLSYAYGIFYYQKNMGDVKYFTNNGLTNKEFKKLLSMDILIQGCSISILAIPFTYMIYKLGLSTYLYGTTTIFKKSIVLLALSIILLGVVQMLISRLYYYRRTIGK